MKQISALIIGFAAFAIAPALAEDLTAGKTPAQLFRSDCGACHHSPNGLVKERGNVSGLAAFLREHYTTKAESAAALAAYVSGLASSGGSSRNGRERRRSEGDDPVTTAVPADVGTPPADDPPRRRHTASQGDAAGKRRAHDDGDAPRPPRDVATASPGSAAPARSTAATRASQHQETADPLGRLRSYLSSGLDSGGASAQAARTGGTPKTRKRRTGADETAAGAAPAPAPSAEEAPPAADAAPQPQAGVPAETATETPTQGGPQ